MFRTTSISLSLSLYIYLPPYLSPYLCLSLSLSIYLSPPPKIECVGKIEGGLWAAEWSPDDDLLCLSTLNGTLMLLTKEWDVLYESNTDGSEEWSEKGKPINVSLSWRGDAEFFVASYQYEEDTTRTFTVFDRNCQVQSQAEGTPLLSPFLTWQPEGALITGSQKRKVGKVWKHNIVFFEKNGLRHYEFALKYPDSEVFHLDWNCSSSLLSVGVRRLEGRDVNSYIEVWHRRNYHWYLKASFLFASQHLSDDVDLSLISCFEDIPDVVRDTGRVVWDPEQALVLYMVSMHGILRKIEFCWDVCVSRTPSRMCAVVDHDEVKLTPLGKVALPPPMSASVVKVRSESTITSVSFTPSGSLAVLESRLGVARLSLYQSCEALETAFTAPSLLQTLYFAEPSGKWRQLEWIAEDTFVVIEGTGEPNGADVLIEYRLSSSTSSPSHTVSSPQDASDGKKAEEKSSTPPTPVVVILDEKTSRRTPFTQPILRLFSVDANHAVAVQLADGSVTQYMSMASGPSLSPLGALPTPCPLFSVVRFGEETVLIGMDTRARLFVNQTLISPQCLSFSALPDHKYVVFTVGGRQNAMFFLDTTQSLEEVLKVENRTDPHAVRYMERGAEILSVIPHSLRPQVVVQLPRGNLEVVHPRMLCLDSVNEALSKHDFKTAFEACRTHRIDMNLLYDHDPEMFLSHCAEFVAQLDDADRVNLFVTSLRDENVTTTEYPGYVPLPSAVFSSGAGGDYEEAKSEGGFSIDMDHIPEEEAGAEVEVDEYKGVLGPDGKEIHWKHKEFLRKKAQLERSVNESKRVIEKHAASTGGVGAAATAVDRDGERVIVMNAPRTVGKTNVVCEAVRAAVREMDAEKYILTTLTTLAKHSPPRLEDALVCVRSIRDNTAKYGGKNKATSHATSALKYLIFLADVNQLYNIALGMYDFDLVMMVAQHSQKDPKEYVPFLNGLKTLPLYYRNFQIDQHLKRHEAGLHHLSASGVQHFDELKAYIKQHSLFAAAVKLFSHLAPGLSVSPSKSKEKKGEGEEEDKKREGDSDDSSTPPSASALSLLPAPEYTSEHWRDIMKMHASDLDDQLLYVAAGDAYMLCGEYKLALDAFVSGVNWGRCMDAAFKLQYKAEALRELASDLATTLVDTYSRHDEASQLVLTYCNDPERAITYLVSGCFFMEAVRLCHFHSREDLVETHLLPQLTDTAYSRIRGIQSIRSDFEYCSSRLRSVRLNKLANPEQHIPPEMRVGRGGAGEDDDGTMSMASGMTGVSMFSDFSFASTVSNLSSVSSASTASIFSVNVESRPQLSRAEQKRLRRREQKRKNKKVKEGHKREEEDLLRRLKKMVPAQSFKTHIGELTRTLLYFDYRTEALALQQAMEDLLSFIALQEAVPMPTIPEDATPLLVAIQSKWDWPREIYPVKEEVLLTKDATEKDHASTWRVAEALCDLPADLDANSNKKKSSSSSLDDDSLHDAMMHLSF